MGESKTEPQLGVCAERQFYMEEFLQSIRELGMLQTEQAQAIVDDDQDFARFDLLIHMANERKDRAKYAWLLHVERHKC